MLKLNVLKGSVQAITFFISVLSNHIKGKENKKTFVSSSTHQVDDYRTEGEQQVITETELAIASTLTNWTLNE